MGGGENSGRDDNNLTVAPEQRAKNAVRGQPDDRSGYQR
jgi:hypothetical protein